MKILLLVAVLMSGVLQAAEVETHCDYINDSAPKQIAKTPTQAEVKAGTVTKK
jgi:hypothetical protein